jgi:hypothetical protein
LGVWVLCVSQFCRNSVRLHPIDFGIEAADFKPHDLAAVAMVCTTSRGAPPSALYRPAVRNGQGKILREVPNLERTGAEGYREVSECIPGYTKRDER